MCVFFQQVIRDDLPRVVTAVATAKPPSHSSPRQPVIEPELEHLTRADVGDRIDKHLDFEALTPELRAVISQLTYPLSRWSVTALDLERPLCERVVTLRA